jgi:hypothetical protein
MRGVCGQSRGHLLPLKLGLFGFALALAGPDERKIGFVLGLFGFVFIGAKGGLIFIILCGDWVCGDFWCFGNWVRLYKKGAICRGYSTLVTENAKIKMQNAKMWRPFGRDSI